MTNNISAFLAMLHTASRQALLPSAATAYRRVESSNTWYW